MASTIRRELIFVILWILLLLVAGTLYDLVFEFLFAGLLVYVIWNFYNLNMLSKWLANPSKKTPEVFGIWDDIYYQLYHLYKRQRKARRKLTSILKRFQKSTQALPEATIALNKANEIEWFNPAARQMFNLHPGLDIGQRIYNLVRQPKFVNYLLKKDFKKPLEFTLKGKKINISITPYGDGQYLVSARDITAQSQLDDMRRDFISNASHELRTPLTVMSGYIEYLQDKTDDTTKHPLEKIQQQTVRMDKIISELIDLAKLESASAVDYTKTVDIVTLLNEAYKEALSFDQNKHHIELAFEAEGSASKPAAELYGCYEELRMAISNLLTNAIRYTPENGNIKLYASTHDKGLSICVQDSGVGISEEHIPRLTERFYRVDAGRSSEKGGTGLGLAIVKQILDRHSASLNIVSKPNEGSNFCCNFPLSSIKS
ncbi:MAG: phosphate regulon sensor histidine kinase PhoR [Gammaproteobacteria bacterium]|nr:phosphate regulon sensor histidine kinase PhoR [Gammaproteobacteria bacterium]